MNHFGAQHTQKNRLPCKIAGRYSSAAAAKSAAGRCNPEFIRAHNRAYAVFLCAMHRYTQFMVGRAGQPKGWPGSRMTGIATPARLTTHERCNSGGELTNLSSEAAIMATTPTKTHPKNHHTPLSVDCYRKLHRAQWVSQSLFLDLHSRPVHGKHASYIHFLFSYLADDLSDISEELNAAGLFNHFLPSERGDQ
ncbi:ash family protein [Serratia marcescens]|uniref:ash family protein n=1 Tax=Serratia marcescens TaxID=615 RepID=UPI00325FA9B4